jgi:hypothetical protein
MRQRTPSGAIVNSRQERSADGRVTRIGHCRVTRKTRLHLRRVVGEPQHLAAGAGGQDLESQKIAPPVIRADVGDRPEAVVRHGKPAVPLHAGQAFAFLSATLHPAQRGRQQRGWRIWCGQPRPALVRRLSHLEPLPGLIFVPEVVVPSYDQTSME